MTRPRFSRATLAAHIARQVANLPAFSSKDGWNQVNGKGEDANRNYGAWRALLDLADEFELDLRREPKPEKVLP